MVLELLQVYLDHALETGDQEGAQFWADLIAWLRFTNERTGVTP